MDNELNFQSGRDFLNVFEEYNGARLQKLLEALDTTPPTTHQMRDILRLTIEMRDYLSDEKRFGLDWSEAVAGDIDYLILEAIEAE